MEKEQLREQTLEKRNALDLDDIMEKSNAINEKLFTLKEVQDAECVLFYSSKDSEVRTMEMVEEALSRGKRVAMPVLRKKDADLMFVEVESSAGLQKNEMGVPQPSENNKVAITPEELDLIVAPNVAFAENGNRLGQGFGFFDKIFEKSTAKRVGLAFDLQLVEDVPIEEHDQALDIIVTEAGIYRKKAPV
tara:strand:- start:599 stop:1171 length:573 start_codon:yes stop_codon:yes gene_type:complete